jgi:Tfp pilus assembly protein PilN
MSTSELGDRKMMIVSVRKEVVEFYSTLIRQAGLVVENIDLSSLSLSRSVQSALNSVDSWMTVNIGNANSELIVVEKGFVVFSRSASIGTSVPDWINKLFFELKRSFESYTMEFGKAVPETLVLCGGGSLATELTKVLNEKLSGLNQIMDIRASLGKSLHTEPEQAVNYAVAYGLLLAPSGNLQSCNLLVPRLFAPIKRHMSIRYKQVAVGIGSAVVIVLILMGALYMRQRKLDRLKTEYDTYSTLVAKSDQISASTSLIRNWKQEQTSILDILRELSSDWTDETYLQVLTYDKTKDITVTGLASSNQAVAELLMKLNKSPRIGNTKFTYIRASKRNPSYPVEFGLSMIYKSSTTATIIPVAGRSQ